MSGSIPTSRLNTPRTDATSGSAHFHSAEEGMASGAAASGASGDSVSLALPGWAPRLFGRGGGARAPEDDAAARQGRQEQDAQLWQSSVVVRTSVPPLANTAATPRFGRAAAAADASPAWQGQAARRYTAELATTHRPMQPPPGPAPPEASPLRSSLQLFGGQSPDPQQQPQQQHSAVLSASSQKLRGSLFADDDDDPPPSAPPPPPAGRFGWFRHPQPAVPAAAAAAAGAAGLPAAAAVGLLPAPTWSTESASKLSRPAGSGGLPPPPSFCVPSAASMHRFPSSHQPEDHGKPSPSKPLDASAFHLDAYAGATTASDSAAAGAASGQGQRPSRTAALRQRHARQLRQQDRDQFGVPVASSARPFSLWASPQKIGEACTGLGVYFASVQQFVVAALLLSLVGVYPLASNLTSQAWADSYTLLVDEAPALRCGKGWDTSSWVTGSTAGSRCASPDFSSSFDCPAVCTWSQGRLRSEPFCAGLLPLNQPRGARAANASCPLHAPCGGGTDSKDPAAPGGPCYCCDLQLDVSYQQRFAGSGGGSTAVPAAQLWVLWLGQLLFLTWVLFLTRTQLRAAHAADARVITASDYAVLVRGLPASLTDAELRDWCSHYGSVVAAHSIPDAGDAIRVARRLQDLLVRQAESDAWLAASSTCSCCFWWFSAAALGAASRRRLQRQLDAAAHKLRCYERQDLRPTGAALAVFEYAEHAANMVEDHHRAPARRLLDASLCGATATAPRLASRRVRVRRAPEPSDILWHHTACTGGAAAARRGASAALTLLLVAAGAALQYGLALAAERERTNKMSALYSPGSGVDGSLDFSSWGAFTASALEVTKLNAISILSGLAVVVVNWLVTLAVRRLTVLERWHTRTAGERCALLKLSLAYLGNAFVVPLLAAQFAGSSSSWYSRGGLLESAFYMQVANALLPPLATLVDLEDLLYMHVLSRQAKTQAMTNRLLEPPPFLLAEQYASALTTLGVAVCWMPVLPISPFIAVAALLLHYWADKVVALRRCAHPGNMRGKLVSSASLVIRLMPLAQLLLMRFLFFRGDGDMEPVFWVGLAVWLLFAIAPLRALLGLVPRRRSTVTGGLPFGETLGGGQRRGLDDRYEAEMPPCMSVAYQERVAAAFAPLPEPHPADETLLPRQRPALGGVATRQPFRPDQQADRDVARAVAVLRARQHSTLSASFAAGNRGPIESQPGTSRLARGLSSLADSVAGGAAWLWNAPDPDAALFSYDWRKAGREDTPESGLTPAEAAVGRAAAVSPLPPRPPTGVSP